jgi:hypothetical protein
MEIVGGMGRRCMESRAGDDWGMEEELDLTGIENKSFAASLG